MPQVSEVKATQVVGTLKPSVEMYSLPLLPLLPLCDGGSRQVREVPGE